MVLICISLKISDVGHIFVWLLAIGMSLLEKCLFSASIDFFLNCFDCPAKYGLSSFPNQWSNPCSLQWNVEVLITGPPGKPSLTIFLIKIFILYWSIADEQCCDSFRWTAKGLSHTISFFFFFLSYWVVWVLYRFWIPTLYLIYGASQVALVVFLPPAKMFQYSCLENPMDRDIW